MAPAACWGHFLRRFPFQMFAPFRRDCMGNRNFKKFSWSTIGPSQRAEFWVPAPWGHRDSTMILAAYRHGLRVSELVDLRWDQIDFNTATLHVRRVKKGTPATHPIRGDELRGLRRLQREQEPRSPFIFTSERGAPFTTAGFARMIERAGEAAGLSFKAHPHMLRHACGFKLANDGHDTRALQAYLGHVSIQHTVRYTELAPDRFKDFWRR